jgi:hypothetical protein
MSCGRWVFGLWMFANGDTLLSDCRDEIRFCSEGMDPREQRATDANLLLRDLRAAAWGKDWGNFGMGINEGSRGGAEIAEDF